MEEVDPSEFILVVLVGRAGSSTLKASLGLKFKMIRDKIQLLNAMPKVPKNCGTKEKAHFTYAVITKKFLQDNCQKHEEKTASRCLF